MIIGIGLDMVEVARIKRSLDNPRFLDKVFTPLEQEYILSRAMNAQTAAGIFAVKEAVSKALGTGFGCVRWTDVEILREEQGRPYAILKDTVLIQMQSMGGKSVWVSITHIKDYAAAQAIIEG